jgi:hypothetical protein
MLTLAAERELRTLIDACRSESDLDRQVAVLHRINQGLPEPLQLKMPSFLTNDYVTRALDMIEDKMP